MRLNKIMVAVVLFASLIIFGQQHIDADIAKDIQKILPLDTHVEVEDGIVTLTGKFKDAVTKTIAQEALGKVKGVKQVIDKTIIAEPVIQTVSLAPNKLLMR